MRRALSLCSRNFHLSQNFKSNPNYFNNSSSKIIHRPVVPSKIRFFSSSENDSSSNQNTPETSPHPETSLNESTEKEVSLNVEEVSLNVEDVNNKGKYLAICNEFSGDYLSILRKLGGGVNLVFRFSP